MLRRIIRLGIASFMALAVGGSLAASLVSVGCGLQCDRNPNEPPVLYTSGITHNAGTANAWYESAPGTGPYLDFPPGRTYRFTHGLGAPPGETTPWFAFDEFPVADANTGPDRSGAVLGAGNQYTLERQTATTFDVRNDTCSDVRLRVVATLPDFAQTAGSAPSSTPATLTPEAGPDAAVTH